jgi:UDP-glucose 4-epimerase
VDVTVLRFANFIGPTIDTPMTHYLSMPAVPTVLGYDARLQFLHEEDGLEVLRRCSLEDRTGTYNVAADGVLLLSQAIRRAGRVAIPVPAPAVSLVGQMLRRTGLVDFSPEQVKFLRYGRVVDTTRMREELKFNPRYTSVEAFDEFVAARGLRRMITPEQLSSIERRVMTTLGAAEATKGVDHA